MMICSVCDRKRSLSVHTSLPVCLQNKVTLQSAPVGLSAAQRVQNASYTNKQERSLSLPVSLTHTKGGRSVDSWYGEVQIRSLASS